MAHKILLKSAASPLAVCSTLPSFFFRFNPHFFSSSLKVITWFRVCPWPMARWFDLGFPPHSIPYLLLTVGQPGTLKLLGPSPAPAFCSREWRGRTLKVISGFLEQLPPQDFIYLFHRSQAGREAGWGGAGRGAGSLLSREPRCGA